MRPPCEPDAIHRGTPTFAGVKIELWSVAWKVNRTHFMRWYACIVGVMTEDEVHRTSSESPAAAIGQAILYLPENDTIFDRIYGGGQ